jgi:hypothetical protein
MRAAVVAAGVALLAGCAFPDVQVRKRAASDFRCPEEDTWVESLGWSGYVAHGCRQEAEYSVGDGRVLRTSEIRPTGDTRPPLPIDRVVNSSPIGID